MSSKRSVSIYRPFVASAWHLVALSAHPTERLHLSQRFEEFLSQADFELVPDPTPEEVAQQKGLVRDESDIPVALAAINASVDYLVSEDKDFTAQNETTAKLHGQLNALLSGTFLRQVMGWTSKELEEIRDRKWSDPCYPTSRPR